MGGKPNKGTPADKRLKQNRGGSTPSPKVSKPARVTKTMPMRPQRRGGK